MKSEVGKRPNKVSARAKQFVHERSVIPKARPRLRKSAGTTFAADEIEAMRVIFNAVRLSDRETMKRVVDSDAGIRANKKIIAMSDRIHGRER